MSYTIFGAPSRYIQGCGASDSIGEFIAPLGKNTVTVGGMSGLSATRRQRLDSFAKFGIIDREYLFGGEASRSEIARIAGFAAGCDVLIASGGGKAIDAVKAAAEDLSVPCVIIPTIASNDAPCSALAVLYNDDGTFDCLRPLKQSPHMVLADTQIIAAAPVRQLISGMGDALATYYEAQVCFDSGAVNNFGGHISEAAMTLSRLCRDTLFEYGVEAISDCNAKTPSEALERVVEANTLLSGLGFESGGVALAHAVSESLSELEATHAFTHGEKVSFGLIAHMIMSNDTLEERTRVADFCVSVGLPVTLGELGVDSENITDIMTVAKAAAAEGRPSHNFSFDVDADMIFDAMLKADAFGKSIKNAVR